MTLWLRLQVNDHRSVNRPAEADGVLAQYRDVRLRRLHQPPPLVGPYSNTDILFSLPAGVCVPIFVRMWRPLIYIQY